MARLFTSGFEENSLTAGVEWTSLVGSPTIDTSNPRSGTYAGRINSLVNGTLKYFAYQFAAANANGPFFARAYILVNTPPSTGDIIMSLNATSGLIEAFAAMNNDGTVDCFSGDPNYDYVGSTVSLTDGNWHRLEVSLDNTSGAGAAKVTWYCDGMLVGSITTETLTSGVAQLFLGANIGGEANTAGDWLFDDVAINDSTGTKQNTFAGAGSVIVLRPNAAGDNNSFTVAVGGTAGAANDFTRVKEVTPDDATSYNGGVLNTDIDDFNIDNTPSSIGSSDTITLVQVNVRYRAAVASLEAAFKTRIKKAASGTVASSAAITPNSTTWETNTNAVPTLPPLTLYVDPDGTLAWTKATLDTAQIGYNISTSNTNAADISAVWLTVEWVPSSAHMYTQSLSANLEPTGALEKYIFISLSANQTFAGFTSKHIARALTAGTSFIGAFHKVITIAQLNANQTFSGALFKRANKTFLASQTFSGAITIAITRLLIASQTFSGNVAKSLSRSLMGNQTFSGSLKKRTNKTFTANQTFVGSLKKTVNRAFASSQTFSGNLKYIIVQAFTASQTFAGLLRKSIIRTLQANVSFSGLLTRIHSYLKSLSASAQFVGSVTKRTYKKFVGNITYEGNISKNTIKFMVSSLTSTGALSESVIKSLSGVIGFSGFMGRTFFKSFIAAQTFSANFLAEILRLPPIEYVTVILKSVNVKVSLQQKDLTVILPSRTVKVTLNPINITVTLNKKDEQV